MNKQLTKTTNDLIEEMTPKQSKFFSLWLKHGNGVRAAMESYDCKNERSASVIAAENLAKLRSPVKLFLETNGISLSYLTKILIDASIAEKRDQFSGEMYPDHKTRLESVDRLSKWLDVEPKNSDQPENLKRRIIAEEFFKEAINEL